MRNQEQKYLENIRKRVGRTLYKYKLLQPDDRILIGLSGGKDSLVLIEVLAGQLKHLPFKCELIAVHIQTKDVGYGIDTDYLKKKCEELDVLLIVREIEVDLTMDRKKSPCFVCSWLRRKELFKISNELNCTKIALGHHLDDAVETLMLNMIYHASISSLPEKLSMLKGKIELIRPLLHLTNEELKKYALLRGFKPENKLCKYSDSTKRNDVKKILNDINRLHRKAKINMFRSMLKTFPEYLPQIPEAASKNHQIYD